ncbi:MAG: prolipoprotein diacylglyceryl transferase [Ruminococcaceae bacterium]|nr:prolipoprotein diacylglyceryl transferase [Oscillospiraceae bacterium]
MLTAAYNVTFMGLKFKLDPVAFTIPIGKGWDIYWYGILIALGFLLAIIYGFSRAKKYDVDPDRLTDIVLVTTPLAILCARLYYIIFYKGDLRIKTVWDFIGIGSTSGVAGLAIYGGVIGAAVIGLIMCKLRKVNVLDAFDLAACGFLIAQSIGRWGNFFNQEAFGTATGSSWFGMTSEPIAQELGYGVLAHPCFLYESLWCLLGFILLHVIGNHREFKGQLALTYGVWYGFGRMIIEGFRTDSLGHFLRVSQWLSAALMIACATVLVIMFRRLRQAKVDATYTDMFSEVQTFTVTTISNDNNETDGEEVANYRSEETEEPEIIEETNEQGTEND